MARGKGGRPRKSIAEKKANGTYNSTKERRHAAKSRKPARVLPPSAVPDPQALSAIEQACWIRLKEQAEMVGTYTDGDRDSFRQLVIAVAQVEELRLGRANAEGETVVSSRDMLAAMGRAMNWLQEFGLTPASRAEMSVADPTVAAGSPGVAAAPADVDVAGNVVGLDVPGLSELPPEGEA